MPLHLHTNNKYAAQMPYIGYFLYRYEATMSLYFPHMNSLQSAMSPQALLCIHFTLLAHVPKQICHICCLTVLLLYSTYKLHIITYISKISKPVSLELNSNMHICYAFGNHIYSLSWMFTHVFFVWQVYFVLLPMSVTLATLHMCIMPIKSQINSNTCCTFMSNICSFTSMIPQVFLVSHS